MVNNMTYSGLSEIKKKTCRYFQDNYCEALSHHVLTTTLQFEVSYIDKKEVDELSKIIVTN